MNDPRVEASSKALYAHHEAEADAQNATYVGLPVDEFDCCVESVLAAADAADREQGIHRVRVDDETVHAMALEMVHHHRLDPMTSRDRCTCGYVTPLGHLFSSHVARAVLAALTGADS